MRFDIITLFPELFAPHLVHGITRRAFESGQIELHFWPLRDHASGTYRRVDDRPFGGGPGMVMLAEPLERALQAVAAARPEMMSGDAASQVPVVHFSPAGRRLDQNMVQHFAQGPGAVLLCGRYEGVDQRVLDRYVTHEISLGDFVLSGGEIPALALLDAVGRLQPEVLSEHSHQQDSFSDGLLEGPCYSRPESLPGREGAAGEVPAVLLSGHHGQIQKWRRERSLEITARRRPDLIASARAEGRLSREDEAFLRTLPVGL